MARLAGQSASKNAALRYALKLLSMRGRTRQELASALERKGFSADQSSVLEHLTQLGYLDDSKYAKDRATSLLQTGRFGLEAVIQKLMTAGIADAGARGAVHSAARELDFDEIETAKRVLAKRGSATPTPRAARLLRTRGFSTATVERLLGCVDLDSPAGDD